jgi:hypothetical protein
VEERRHWVNRSHNINILAWLCCYNKLGIATVPDLWHRRMLSIYFN